MYHFNIRPDGLNLIENMFKLIRTGKDFVIQKPSNTGIKPVIDKLTLN